MAGERIPPTDDYRLTPPPPHRPDGLASEAMGPTHAPVETFHPPHAGSPWPAPPHYGSRAGSAASKEAWCFPPTRYYAKLLPPYRLQPPSLVSHNADLPFQGLARGIDAATKPEAAFPRSCPGRASYSPSKALLRRPLSLASLACATPPRCSTECPKGEYLFLFSSMFRYCC